MSADNGFVLRVNDEGKYVLQEYSASASTYPDINNATLVFDTVEEAVRKYGEIEARPMMIIEYGLSVIIEKPWSQIDREAARQAAEEVGRPL